MQKYRSNDGPNEAYREFQSQKFYTKNKNAVGNMGGEDRQGGQAHLNQLRKNANQKKFISTQNEFGMNSQYQNAQAIHHGKNVSPLRTDSSLSNVLPSNLPAVGLSFGSSTYEFTCKQQFNFSEKPLDIGQNYELQDRKPAQVSQPFFIKFGKYYFFLMKVQKLQNGNHLQQRSVLSKIQQEDVTRQLEQQRFLKKKVTSKNSSQSQLPENFNLQNAKLEREVNQSQELKVQDQKRNSLKSAGTPNQDQEKEVRTSARIDYQSNQNHKIKYQYVQQKDTKNVRNSNITNNQVSTKSSFHENQNQIELPTQLYYATKPQRKTNEYKNDEDIYADEFDISDNEESKVHSQTRPVIRQGFSPKREKDVDNDIIQSQKIRNTVYGTGFFDQRQQRNSKQNNKHSEKYHNPIVKPDMNKHKKSNPKFINQGGNNGLPTLSRGANQFPPQMTQGIIQQQNSKGRQQSDLLSPNLRVNDYQQYNPYEHSHENLNNPHGAVGYQTYHGSFWKNKMGFSSTNLDNSHNKQPKFKIKFQVNNKNEALLKRNAMQKDHKENLNLLFYDFNHSSSHNPDIPLSSIVEEGQEPDLHANFQNMVSSTGTNFFTKIGDRLPTRDAKSRRGRGVPSSQGLRGHSMVPDSKKQILVEEDFGFSNNQSKNKQRMSKEKLTKSTSRDKLIAMTQMVQQSKKGQQPEWMQPKNRIIEQDEYDYDADRFDD